MKKKFAKTLVALLGLSFMPVMGWAQSPPDELHGLQQVLNNLYNQMIPLCGQITGVGQGIAGFAATWYIAVRVWRHIANAEPVDFYPLFRPFVIGFCIAFFPMVLSLINGILSPTVSATDAMVQNTNQALQNMLGAERQQLSTPPTGNPGGTDNNPDKWYQYTHPDNPAGPAPSSNPISAAFSAFSISHWIKKAVAYILELCYKAAVLCIDTIRTFKLIVLAILGPLAFGLSVFDGFQHTLKHWLARYVNVYMWLPVANIFGAITAKIQLNMMQLAANGGSSNPFFGDTNTAYLIFLLIAIVGYFTVPSIAGYIVHVGGHALFSKTTALSSMAVSTYTGAVAREIMSYFNGSHSGTTVNTKISEADGRSSNNYMTKKISG